ncbi:MAG: hypothetical protein JSR33_07655, partial [Proteobacteria bacterium]|nr:hypothetical protein [Pseudomonadota bacterium]
FIQMSSELVEYRKQLTELRKREIVKQNPDLAAYLDYSTCFYHYIKLLELLAESSQAVAQLQGRV